MNGSGARRAAGAASGLDDASDPPDDASSPSNLRGAGQPPLSSVRRVAAATALRHLSCANDGNRNMAREAGAIPQLVAMLEERNVRLARSITEAADRSRGNVVAILGALHVNGVARLLKDPAGYGDGKAGTWWTDDMIEAKEA